MSYICSNCRTNLSKNDIFCPNCGKKNEVLAKRNKIQFWLPFILIAIAYVMAIALHIVIGISTEDYYREKSKSNWYFQFKTIIVDFFIQYLLVFILLFIITLNKKNKLKNLSVVSVVLSSFIIISTALIMASSLLALLIHSQINLEPYWKIIDFLRIFCPYSSLGSFVYFSIKYHDFYWQQTVRIIGGIINFSALVLFVKYSLKELKEISKK